MFRLTHTADHKFCTESDLALFDPRSAAVGDQIIKLRFAFTFTGAERDYDDYTARVLKACDSEFPDFFATRKLSAVTKNLSTDELAQWLKQRIEKKIPGRVKVNAIEIDCMLLSPNKLCREYFHAEVDPQKNLRGNFAQAIARLEPSIVTPEAKRFVEIMHQSSLLDKQGRGEPFFSRQDVARVLALMGNGNKTGEPVNFVTFICPPYSKTHQDGAHKNYNSIHPNFHDDPHTYQFDYDYNVPIRIMASVLASAKSSGVNARAHIVLGDWGLICIDSILSTMGSEEDILGNLSSFFNGMNGHVQEKYVGIEMSSFQRLGSGAYMPIGLPYSTESRLGWLHDFCNGKPEDGVEDRFAYLRAEMQCFLKIAEDDAFIERLLDWHNYDEAYLSLSQNGEPERSLSKNKLVEVAKVYRNIYELRRNESATVAERENPHLRNVAYVDTLLRYTEYQIYSGLFTAQHGKSVCMYSDPKFSSCGHFFRQEDMAIAFIDDQKYVNSMRHDPAYAELFPVCD